MNFLKALVATSTVFALANTAMAADGRINFTGEVIAASCTISAGAGSSVGGSKGNQNVDVNLGKVSMDSLGGGSSGGIAAGTAINLNLDCGATGGGLKSVKLAFDPWSGSGVDAKNNSLLKVNGTATGVGIGLYNADNKLLNLAGNESINGPLVGADDGKGGMTYSANLNLRAAYVANSEPLAAGTANGTLPFTLTYE